MAIHEAPAKLSVEVIDEYLLAAGVDLALSLGHFDSLVWHTLISRPASSTHEHHGTHRLKNGHGGPCSTHPTDQSMSTGNFAERSYFNMESYEEEIVAARAAESQA